jgi:hypothetical protein
MVLMASLLPKENFHLSFWECILSQKKKKIKKTRTQLKTQLRKELSYIITNSLDQIEEIRMKDKYFWRNGK